MARSPEFRVLCTLLLFTICSCSQASSHNNSVWDVYDIRHPVPAQSTVPVSPAANPFNQNPYGYVPPSQYPNGAYGDNDDVYVPPKGPIPNYGGKGIQAQDVCETGDIGIGCN